MNALHELKEIFRPIISGYVESDAAQTDAMLAMIRPAGDAKHGDFQANFAMALGKRAGKPPREVAQAIASAADLSTICQQVDIAGPGFINLKLNDDWIKQGLKQALADEKLAIAPVAEPRNYIVDYSSPNVAKPMHVGHIRSTVIGDALTRILSFMGHQAKSDNHLGDWGTQFGMILYGYKHFRDQAAFDTDTIGELSRLYRLVRKLIDFHGSMSKLPELESGLEELETKLADLKKQQSATDEKAAVKKIKKEINQVSKRVSDAKEKLEKATASIAAVQADPTLAKMANDHPEIGTAVLIETSKLHAGDAENKGLWREFLPVCKQDMQAIYDRLSVEFDMTLGESYYNDMLSEIVNELEAKGYARESDGAMCVFLDDFETPMIVRKKDGAFLYSTTDLATIKYRMKNFDADACLYVVDHRQHEHFEKLFAVAKLWGYEQAELKHVSFGTVMGKDGKPFQTRSGDTVGLAGLLNEAEKRAGDIARELNEGIAADQLAENARVVGIGSLKYADLSQNRSSDYTFDYEKMLALKGNTAAYLQYGYARVQGILRKVDIDPAPLRSAPVDFEFATDVERALAVQLLRFEEALSDVLIDYKPNLLCNYLFDLGQTFFKFYDQCSLKDTDSQTLKQSRVQLCDLTARTIKTGLSLLNIGVLDQM
jgi:arginyl-tRNA synthetase